MVTRSPSGASAAGCSVARRLLRLARPGMTTLTCGWSTIQRSANCAMVAPSGTSGRSRSTACSPISYGTPAKGLAHVEGLAVTVVVAVVVAGERGVEGVRAAEQPRRQRHPAMIADARIGGAENPLERPLPEDVEDDLHARDAGGRSR
jgi:hypothetical protein